MSDYVRTNAVRGRARSYKDLVADGEAELEAGQRKPTLAEQIDWARGFLPDESPALVVGAANTLRYAGEQITREAITARLEAQGRDRRALA